MVNILVLVNMVIIAKYQIGFFKTKASFVGKTFDLSLCTFLASSGGINHRQILLAREQAHV
ncbi:hypothetical protein SE27_01495 [Acinetobacter harbinensis]|nr:hypothetical protein SE27_01495 [Acinetobacter harbinensis]